ncbi:FGGY carbohydrate kinase domain-containing protein [Hypsibius exemplaris]|uniref:FGGY carbohydrate kinase domain-containing protein n=1 Tax=Hypsibius exemplaris TaxID=2072580 RepID=A0A1W0X8C0_HYPEX|nr:FGGY carbohydrate kinase domain-containing protein [Hypsibius exemplaris]
MENQEPIFFVGVDVGTASVRAGLYSLASKSFRKTAILPITVHKATVNVRNADRTRTELISQSSTEIWDAVCRTVRDVSVGVDERQIRGIGFDATCSLVVVGPGDAPMNVDGLLKSDGTGEEGIGSCLDIIMWMDHRAKKETEYINQKLADHPCLKFVGGQVSLEMEIPKLLWLKTHCPDIFHGASRFMDLCDFLSWKASGDTSRSMCSVVCKWLYQADPRQLTTHGWDRTIFSAIGLEELCQENFAKIGTDIRVPGGKDQLVTVSEKGSSELGLTFGTPVGTSLIDAHAGGLALAFCGDGKNVTDWSTRLALICGTSTCYMQCNREPVFVPGVWGPYYSAMVPQAWLNEAGQSAAGQFLDHIVKTHPFYLSNLKALGMSACYNHLNQRAVEISQASQMEDTGFLSNQLHVFPDYHGNRSPLSNPDFTGMIVGLTLDGESELSLVKLYLAAMQGLAYESRWIIESLQNNNIRIGDLAICGGLANNPLFVKTLADVVGMPVLLPFIKESVMLGAAILGATASGALGGLEESAAVMAGSGSAVQPAEKSQLYHKARYHVFRKMADFQLSLLDN